MATGKIKTLFSDIEKTEALFPRTKVGAVSDADGTGLDAILDDLNSEISTKATEAFVTNKIAEAQLSGGSGCNIDLSGYATKDDVRNIDFPVDSVNGKTGTVSLTASDIGAAPSGFGLGGSARQITWAEVDTATQNGWYNVIDEEREICGIKSGYAYMHVSGFDINWVTQTLHLMATNNLCVVERKRAGGTTWSEWSKIYTTANKPTPADISAMANTSAKWLPQNGMSIRDFPSGITMYSVNPGDMIAEGPPTGFSEYATVTGFKLAEYDYYEYTDVFGNKAVWNTNANNGWNRVYTTNFKPTIAEIGAAPAGYGLGEYAPFITDANEAILPGFYRFDSSKTCANIPSEWQFPYGTMIVSRGSAYIEQLFLAREINAKRTCTNGTWGEWEYINPPMVVGVKYRTIERWNNKAVYTLLLDLGTTTTDCSGSVNIPGITSLVRAVPVLDDRLCTDWDIDAAVHTNNQFYFCPEKVGEIVYFYMHCGAYRTGKNIKAQIWYTK